MKSLLLEVNKRERCASRLDVDELREWWDYGQIKGREQFTRLFIIIVFCCYSKSNSFDAFTNEVYIIVMRRVNDVISFLCLQSYPTCIHRR